MHLRNLSSPIRTFLGDVLDLDPSSMIVERREWDTSLGRASVTYSELALPTALMFGTLARWVVVQA